MIQYNIFITDISIHWFEFWKITTTHGWYVIFEDDKGVIISGKSKEKLWPKEKIQKNKQLCENGLFSINNLISPDNKK
jgi:hypothetical protein